MKINPLGVQAYQQLNRQDRPPVPDAQRQSTAATGNPTVVEPQNPSDKSALAVRGPSGSYAQYLSEAEREAIDMLFARFGDNSRFGFSGRAESTAGEPEKTIGRLVDVKV